MRWEILSPAIVAAAACILVVLERWRPYDRRQRLFREGFANDLVLYTFVQSYVLGVIIKLIVEMLDRRLAPWRPHFLSSWSVPAQVGFFFVTHDLYIYLFHRLQHRSPILWRTHEAHHSTRDVDWLSGSRSHPLEILINQTVEFAPVVLLGAAPEVWLIKTALDAVWGMYIHANLDVRSGPLQYVINGPEMHRWHHAEEITTGVNFATKLAIWDWLFGTAHRPPTKPASYGVADLDFPPGYLRQVLHAFRRERPAQAITSRPEFLPPPT
jgi:sterol desaturase/sphingolipid hydroxylase (fatty acid hydroxylase superfamily)